MDEIQEAAVVEANLGALADDASAELILDAIRGYSEAAIQIALRRLSGGGGAAAPVCCLLARDANMDIHAQDNHPILWDALYDNGWNFNTLGAIPDGLGLDFSFDGTDGVITTTEAGTWAFTYVISASADNNWRGGLTAGPYTTQFSLLLQTGVLITEVVNVPEAASMNQVINTGTASTADPFNATVTVEITRLA